MSIDLSKVTAISDPYGAWKQLADASGRVLWSAVEPVTSLVFRPNSDVDVDTTVWALMPSGSTTAYSLLSEEVADDESTYIAAIASSGTKTGCVIGLGCENTPNRIPKITGGKCYVRHSLGSDITGSVRLYINDMLSDSNEIASQTVSSNSSYFTQTLEITTDGIAKINEYVSTNGKFPTFLMYAKYENGSTKGKGIKITQAYLELACGA